MEGSCYQPFDTNPAFSLCYLTVLSSLPQSPPLNSGHNFPQVFVHGDELENYVKEFDADILPADFDGKASTADCQAIATKLFGSEDTAL